MPGQTTIVIGEKQWTVAVANTLAEVTTGLSGVSSIPAQTGMLFDLATNYSAIQIDMSRMLFALDIVFINSTQGVVGVMHDVRPGETDVHFENVNLPGARWFLEINAGEAEGISAGDDVVIQGSTASAPLDMSTILNFAITMMVVVFMGRMAIRAVSPPKPKPELYGPRGERLLPQTGKGKPSRQDVEVDSWAERDRMGIWLTDKRTDKTIAEWWDEDAREMFEQGFFKPGDIRHQTITGRAFEESVLDYAESVGLLSGGGKYQPQTMIEGGEPLPSRYRDLISFIDEPLPEYSLSTLDLMPAVEPEVGEKKIDAVMRQLKSGVETIQQSEEFRHFLITMSRFHDYSIGNQILIMLQRPDATKVAGFNTWKDLGRWVKKGEKGISILAPIMPPRPTCPECGAKILKGARLCPKCGADVEEEAAVAVEARFFKVVYVFDLSQTEGKPLPEFEVPALTGVVNEELFRKLLELMKERGVSVSFESRPHQDPGIKGQYSPVGIWVRPEETRAQQLKSLLHEIAHYYSEGVFHIPRRDAETIAESAAYVVGAHHGFDSGVRSFPYVALWAEEKKVLDENLGAVRRVATTIMKALEEVGEAAALSPQLKGAMPRLPEEAKKDPLFVDYIQDMIKLGERVSDEEAKVMWEKWKARRQQSYLMQTTPRTELRFADRPQTVTADTLRDWLSKETARPIQTAGWYGAEGYKPRLYVVGETIYQIEWGPAKKHHLLPASQEDMTHETKERLREEGAGIGPPGVPPPGKATRDDVTVGARQKLGVWITDNRTGATLSEWVDKDARGLFEEGLFRGRVPVSAWEAPDSELTESVVAYAESVGLLAKEGPVTHLPQTEKGEYSWLIIDPETGEIMIKPGYAAVSKAKRAARDFALRRARYAGEHPVKLRIYDRDPNIGELDVGIIFGGRILIPEGRIVESESETPAVMPTGPRRPRPGKEELDYLADSPEFLTQTIDATGYRAKIDMTFQEAIRRAKGAKAK